MLIQGNNFRAAAAVCLWAAPCAFAFDSIGAEALIQRAQDGATAFVVQIETVGGVQPLNRLATEARNQGEEDDTRENPNLFRDNPGSAFMLADGPTTGIIYSADGLILTSGFNFVRRPSIVTVRLPDGRQLPADVVARDQVRKLALLKIDATDLPLPEWTPREQIRVGQWAIALGRGYGSRKSTVSVGIISALNRMAGNAIQTDANLSPVNYGGPLIDSQGRVLGICVPMAQRPGELAGIELYDSGIGFAIPSWRVAELVADLQQGKSFHRGWLGMQVDPKVGKGVRIYRLADPSPLRSAGALPGDYIASIDDEPIEHFGQLVGALYMLPAGAQVHIKLLREAEHIDVDVILAQSAELGSLPPLEEPFDPSQPLGEPESELKLEFETPED